MATETIENRTLDEITVGDSASEARTITARDIELLGVVSGDVNPVHFDEAFASGTMFGRRIAHGILSGTLISSVLGMQLPGPGTIYLGQTLRFKKPVFLGDTITTTVTVTEKQAERKRLTLECQCVNQHGDVVTSGSAEVLAPTEKLRLPRPALPTVELKHE
jgi:acyl dehydratase